MSVLEIIQLVCIVIAISASHVSAYYLGKTTAYNDIARKRREIRGGRS